MRNERYYLNVTGQRGTPTFAFKVNDSEIKVVGAQIEVDACFEDADQIILFEAKRGVPSSFNIRQVYYPYRTYYGKKKRVRNFFFCFEATTKSYLFWEYDFKPYDDFESIKLVRFNRYQIKETKAISIKEYQKVTADETKIQIPQADDVNKIIEFPLRVFEGYDTAEKIKEAFDFSYRQSNYYGDAAKILGLVRRETSLNSQIWEKNF